MDDRLDKISQLCERILLQLQVIKRVLLDLEELKLGQDEIKTILRRQGVMIRKILENTRPKPTLHAVFQVTLPDGSVIERVTSVEMKIQQQFQCTVAFEDAAGNPATVDDPPEWSADPADILTLEPDANGLTVLVKSGTKAGSAQLLCKADADLGAGVTEITGMLAVTVLPGDAVTITLNPGQVEDTPQAPGGGVRNPR